VSRSPRILVVVGAGGVGKTTIAAALGVLSARAGAATLVMTFDPSLRLKDALGVGDEARRRDLEVELASSGSLHASLLDARDTFDRLVERYAPDERARDRILANRFYDHLSGTLGGVLEYMAVERLFEVAAAGKYERVILDTPPTRQALDFLEAPQRIVSFLDSGALRIALKPWFDEDGHLRPTRRLGFVGRNVEAFLDRIVGLEVLRDMAEFFHAFGPLYAGFRERATEVQSLLRSERTAFVLVSGPGEERVPDTLFFARRLAEAGHHLGPVIVNRVHPPAPAGASRAADRHRDSGLRLLGWLGDRDRRGTAALRSLLGAGRRLVEVPVLEREPTDLDGLDALARTLAAGGAGLLAESL
jgi:anion-transporting  ArsA/GET3 family ATPase